MRCPQPFSRVVPAEIVIHGLNEHKNKYLGGFGGGNSEVSSIRTGPREGRREIMLSLVWWSELGWSWLLMRRGTALVCARLNGMKLMVETAEALKRRVNLIYSECCNWLQGAHTRVVTFNCASAANTNVCFTVCTIGSAFNDQIINFLNWFANYCSKPTDSGSH